MHWMLLDWEIKPTSSPRESEQPPERAGCTVYERALVSTAFGGAGFSSSGVPVTCQARVITDMDLPKCSSRTA